MSDQYLPGNTTDHYERAIWHLEQIGLFSPNDYHWAQIHALAAQTHAILYEKENLTAKEYL